MSLKDIYSKLMDQQIERVKRFLRSKSTDELIEMAEKGRSTGQARSLLDEELYRRGIRNID